MLKSTKGNLLKLETALKELGFVTRYEKGNFQSGYCVVQHQKVVVVNKFFELEGRINCLMDILAGLAVEDPDALTAPSRQLIEGIKNRRLETHE
jgi:hypothetical protein